MTEDKAFKLCKKRAERVGIACSWDRGLIKCQIDGGKFLTYCGSIMELENMVLLLEYLKK